MEIFYNGCKFLLFGALVKKSKDMRMFHFHFHGVAAAAAHDVTL
jgi:hypothetical protein